MVPFCISAYGIDFAVVSEYAEGLSEGPRGECIGRESLVVDGEVGDEEFVEEVWIEGGELFCEEESFVDDGSVGEGANVEVGYGVGDDLFFYSSSYEEESFFEVLA